MISSANCIYTHYMDFSGGRFYMEDFQKKWSILEIREECFSVINQIIKILSSEEMERESNG